MNKIVDVSIKDNSMSFYIYTNISIVNTNDIVLYIDECTNVHKIYCDDPDNHNYVLNYLNSEFTFREVVLNGGDKEVTTLYLYEVSATSDLISSFDNNMKYIKLFCTTERYANDYAEGVYYDPSVLYEAQLRRLRKHCSTCLDDKQMLLVVLIVYKRLLLELAIASTHNKDALHYYLDLCKLLDVSITTEVVNSDCNKCINGVCKL